MTRLTSATAGVLGVLLAVLGWGNTATRSAFTARLSNSANTQKVSPYTYCQTSQLTDNATAEYPLVNSTYGPADQARVTSNVDLTTVGGISYNPAQSGCTRDPSGYATLNGTSGYYYVNTSINYTSSSTVSQEIWFQTKSTQPSLLMGFGNQTTGGSTAKGFAILLTAGGGVDFATYTQGTNNEIISPKRYNDGAWHHVIAVYDAGRKTLHVDGERVGMSTALSESLTSVHLRIGADSLEGWNMGTTTRYVTKTPQYFNGSLAYASVYGKALTDELALKHYQAGR